MVAEVQGTLDEPPSVEVYGVFPHMHTLGRKLRVERERGGEGGARECFLDVPKWDFDGQQFYFYTTPLLVEVGDRVNLTCTYDTTTRTATVTWGEGTDDEMCLAGFYIVKRAM